MAFLQVLVGACALLSIAQAAPVADVTVTNVVTETHYTTKNCVKTVWLPKDQSPSATSTFSQGPSTTLLKSVLYTTRVSRTTKSVLSPAPTSVYVPPTTSSPVPVPVPTTSAYIPPAPVTTEAPVYNPPTTTEAPVPAPAPEPATSSVAPASTPANSSGDGAVEASAANNCESPSTACEGDVTHYDGGLGACGWNVDTAADMAIALPVGFMGSQSNGNPYCGRTVTIKNPNTGTTIQAKVGDKCMGCVDRAIDLTDALFKAVTDGTGDGREAGYQWWFS